MTASIQSAPPSIRIDDGASDRDTAVPDGATESPRSRRRRNPHERRRPMARLRAFPTRSRLAALTAMALLVACGAYGAATSAASTTTRATTIRVVDYYAVEPD